MGNTSACSGCCQTPLGLAYSMSGHWAIQYDPAGQPRAAGQGCIGLVRLLYARYSKVNVFVRTTRTTSPRAVTASVYNLPVLKWYLPLF